MMSCCVVYRYLCLEEIGTYILLEKQEKEKKWYMIYGSKPGNKIIG